MPKIGKNVLSQYLRTQCDRLLYLSIFTPTERENRGLPEAIKSRPSVQILRDEGRTWEQAKFADLKNVFGDLVIGTEQEDKYVNTDLLSLLSADLPTPAILIQGKFGLPELKRAALSALGLSETDIARIPDFSEFIPDIAMVCEPAADFDEEVLPDGTRLALSSTEERKAIRLSDIKHAGEANSSYSTEVALYAFLLSNWLRLQGLDEKYFVSSRISLWTREEEVSNIVKLVNTTSNPTLAQRLEALSKDLEAIDFATYMQAVRRFFEVDLLRVLGTSDWKDLEWHVDGRCSACDFLGYTKWLNAENKAKVDANPTYYCYELAKSSDHLSRIAFISRGARRTLEGEGYTTTAQIASTQPADAIFDQHNALKAERKRLPARAQALGTSSMMALEVTFADFPTYADLEAFITVNFDPGTGLLTGLGLAAYFRQRVPFQAPAGSNRNWRAEGFVVDKPTSLDEQAVLISFLSRLAEIFRFAYDPDPAKGGALARKTRTQIYFWDKTQFSALTDALGRHLTVILNQQERVLKSLAWLFPPEEILPDDELSVSSSITFVKDIVRRGLILPTEHAVTLFNVAESYYDENPPSVPDSFFMRDPFSDMIPRERIYEIWSNKPLIKIGQNNFYPRSTCIGWYADAIEKQIACLRQITWKLRSDLSEQLIAEARPIELRLPFDFRGIADDSKLWYGWILYNEAVEKLERKHTYVTDPEEIEAKYAAIRFESEIGRTAEGDIIYRVSPNSRDVKFKNNQRYLLVQDESIPGFAQRRLKDVARGYEFWEVTQNGNHSMHHVYGAELISFDRNNLEATVRLSSYGEYPAIRGFLESNGLVQISSGSSLIEGEGVPFAPKVRACLNEIGVPPIATASPAALRSLGRNVGRRTRGTDSITPAARVLWEASQLSQTGSGISQEQAEDVLSEVNTNEPPLNVSQQNAIKESLQKQLSIIWGPPGTGKTTTGAALLAARIRHALRSERPLRVLITGPTYNAWENLVEKTLKNLSALATDATVYRVYSSGHPERGVIPPNLYSGLNIKDAVSNASDPMFQSLLQDLDTPSGVVIVGTVVHQCYKILQDGFGVALKGLFDFIAVDESSQLDVGYSLFPLCTLAENGQLVFLGDHLQMPPITAAPPPDGAEFMVGSIQKYLRERFSITEQPLLENYRSAQDFVEFAKRIGYPADLRSTSPNLSITERQSFSARPSDWPESLPWSEAWGEIMDRSKRVGAITYSDGKSGQANEFEASIILCLVTLMWRCGGSVLSPDANSQVMGIAEPFDEEKFWKEGVGIVTPHRAQRSLIVRLLKATFPSTNPDLIDGAVDTVERFQGGERQLILISFGAGDPDLISDEEAFLLQLERTNVAISRAQAKCVVLISDELISHLPQDKRVIETSRAIKMYVDEFCRSQKVLSVPWRNDEDREIKLHWRQSSTA